MKQYLKKMRRQVNNKGAGLVFVIITIAIVSILATVILYATSINLQMKKIYKESTKNFYDAETALNEIRTGLQQDLASAATVAYIKVMEQYSDTSYQDNYRYSLFCSELRGILKAKIAEPTAANSYDLNYLKKYLSKSYDPGTGVGPNLKVQDGASNKIETAVDGIVLENLDLTYTDSKRYQTRIQTDIKVLYPDINFTQASSFTEILKYCIVGTKGIVTSNDTQTFTVDGNAYAGADKGFTINDGTIINLANSRELITKGSFIVNSGGNFEGQGKVNLWANDIQVLGIGSKFDLRGSAYVADDLVINGSGVVTLAGEYYGFGNPNSAKASDVYGGALQRDEIDDKPYDYSSSILLNGTKGVTNNAKPSLSLTGLNTLMLAGNAYVSNSNIMMSESIAVKSNQVAYLVPDDCFVEAGATNPSTRNNLGVDSGKLRDTLGASGYEKLVNNGLTYYFMTFDNAMAANKYFNLYYNEASDDGLKNILKRNRYMEYYVNNQALTVKPDGAGVITNGNIMAYDENGIYSLDSILPEGKDDISELEDYAKQQSTWQNVFEAYNRNLSRDYIALTAEQKSNSIFQNIVNVGALYQGPSALLNGATKGAWFTVEVNTGAGIQKYAALLVNNSSGETAIVTENGRNVIFGGNVFGAPAGATVALIVAKNDIQLKTDFKGLLFAGGEIQLDTSHEDRDIKVESDLDTLALLINDAKYTVGSNSYMLRDYFNNPEYFSGIAGTGEGNQQVDYTKLVEFANWRKE